MAAGLGFKTFATGDILTAADANGYLMSQTVMVFADAATRSATITSPQEGMITYLKDSDSTSYYSGSAWVAIGGSSGLSLVKAVTFSAVTTIDLSDSFSSGYENYTIQATFNASADGDLLFNYRVGGANNSTSNYNYQLADIDGTSPNYARLTGQTAGRLCGTRTGTTRTSFKAEFYAPYATSTKNWVCHAGVNTGTGVYVNQITGGFNASTSFTGLTVYPSSGNITGSIRVYGYSNS